MKKQLERISFMPIRVLLAVMMGFLVLVCFAQPAVPEVSIEVVTEEDGDYVHLSWEEVVGAELYHIYATDDLDNWGNAIATVEADVTQYSVSVGDVIVRYFYVTAYAEAVIPEWLALVGGDLFVGEVTIDPFYISKYQVTRADVRDILGADWGFALPNPGAQPEPTDDDYPANNVSWFDTIEYCNRRSIQEGFEPIYSYTLWGTDYGTNPDNWPAGWNSSNDFHYNVSSNWEANGYRLPTEAEWHHAANGGIHDPDSEWDNGSPFYFSGSDDINEVAWYRDNSDLGDGLGRRTHPVGTKAPNSLGIYDMSGNVFEWVWDIWGITFPSGGDNPRGAIEGNGRARQGGSYNSQPYFCAVFARGHIPPTGRTNAIGFRIARNAPLPSEERMVLVDGDLYDGNVEIDPFLVSKYQVTQEEFVSVMGVNPSHFADEDGAPNFENLPVEMVSWYDAIEYSNRLSITEGLEPVYSYLESGTSPDDWYEHHPGWNQNNLNHTNVSVNWEANGYRLPTENEWHHAANAAIHPPPYTYSGSNDLDQVGWYSGNSDIGDGLGGRTHPVGTKAPNDLGIFDMTGNVFEWCWDRYVEPFGGNTRVTRGGGWNVSESFSTLAYRNSRFNATIRRNSLGFRVVRNAQ